MSYENKINTTKIFSGNTKELLRFSIDNEDKKATGCIGWDFLKVNLTQELKDILVSKKYLEIVYNSENTDFILENLNITLDKELKDQLNSLVYIWKDIKTDEDKKESEEKLREKLLKEGFKEVEFVKNKIDETGEEFNRRLEDVYKKFDGLKVECVLDVSKIGMMGSFDSIERIKGKLSYSEYNKSLMLIPGRCRTRGYLIKGRFYFKEVKD